MVLNCTPAPGQPAARGAQAGDFCTLFTWRPATAGH
jgi:hypothetical protein